MDADLRGRYARGPEILAYAAQGLSEEAAREPVAPGQWSIAELIVHVVEADLVLAGRMRWVIAEDDPPLPGFDENAWNERLFANQLDYRAAIDLMAASRRWMLAILDRLDERAFARSGRHSQSGRTTLAELLIGASNHLDHHLRFLYGKRGNLGIAIYPRFTRD
ncbi:MAG: hypothetical protein KatS3mg108_1163 [Isosphaeraceae bacterium]|jgi:uncharacterized damage-inducible protein DinB|nr:MAG: hypothetical protein KatS3mg108_1163 [Isosphaeraceae bacterium]